MTEGAVQVTRTGATPSATTTPTAVPNYVAECQANGQNCDRAWLGLLNQHRAARGVKPLAIDETQSRGTASCRGSLGHSEAMGRSGTIWHTNPSYPKASFPHNLCVSVATAGENVGEAPGPIWSAMQTIDRLMMEEPHSATDCATADNHACNILNPTFRRAGFGIYVSGNIVWLTTDFLG